MNTTFLVGNGAIVGGLMSILQDTNQLVIYGLSLSPLDVELGLVIRDSFHNTMLPDKVVVIDCNPDLVVERLQYLGIKNPPGCYHPEEILPHRPDSPLERKE